MTQEEDDDDDGDDDDDDDDDDENEDEEDEDVDEDEEEEEEEEQDEHVELRAAVISVISIKAASKKLGKNHKRNIRDPLRCTGALRTQARRHCGRVRPMIYLHERV